MTQLLDREVDEAASEVLLASQWNQPSTAQFLDVPERRLLVAVLVDAVRVLLGRDQRQRARVVRWIEGDDARFPFRDLCLNLELDPDATAQKLIRAARRRTDARRISTRRSASAGRRSGIRDRRHAAASAA